MAFKFYPKNYKTYKKRKSSGAYNTKPAKAKPKSIKTYNPQNIPKKYKTK